MHWYHSSFSISREEQCPNYEPKAGNAEFDRNNAQRQAEQELPSHIKFEQTSGKRKRENP